MLGTIVNFFAIIIGSITGLLFKKIIPDRFKITIVQGLGLSVILIGGIIIIGIGINILEIKKINADNMIPSIFIPLIYYIFKLLFLYFFK